MNIYVYPDKNVAFQGPVHFAPRQSQENVWCTGKDQPIKMINVNSDINELFQIYTCVNLSILTLYF